MQKSNEGQQTQQQAVKKSGFQQFSFLNETQQPRSQSFVQKKTLPNTDQPKSKSGLGLPEGFDKKLIEMEFKIEQNKQVTQELILAVIDMYNQAAEHYDRIQDRQLAEIFRMKIAMLFSKPQIIHIYQGGKTVNQNQVKDQPSNEQRDTNQQVQRSITQKRRRSSLPSASKLESIEKVVNGQNQDSIQQPLALLEQTKKQADQEFQKIQEEKITTSNIVMSDIKSQQDSLKERLKNRKNNRMGGQSYSASNFNLTNRLGESCINLIQEESIESLPIANKLIEVDIMKRVKELDPNSDTEENKSASSSSDDHESAATNDKLAEFNTKFDAQLEEDLAKIGLKYQLQIEGYEKKGVNALMKKLIEKAQTEMAKMQEKKREEAFKEKQIIMEQIRLGQYDGTL